MHPDKLRDFSDATKAFQAITQAFERLSNPEQFADEEEETKGKPKTKKLARSNEGCRRTDVLCPRCKVKWSASALEGNPDYFYNFMMMGLKTFNCATCLFEFGCMSAVHKCPFCRKQFEYSPQDYHRRITCGNGTCTKEFGFHMFNASERVMKELRATIKADHDKRVKRVEQKRRRAESNKRRGIGVDSAMSEEAFCLGLADECPRCGRPLKEFRNEEGQRLHLRDCNDTREHAAHAAKKAAAMTQQEEREKGADAQQEAQAAAAWQFLGGNTEQGSSRGARRESPCLEASRRGFYVYVICLLPAGVLGVLRPRATTRAVPQPMGPRRPRARQMATVDGAVWHRPLADADTSPTAALRCCDVVLNIVPRLNVIPRCDICIARCCNPPATPTSSPSRDTFDVIVKTLCP